MLDALLQLEVYNTCLIPIILPRGLRSSSHAVTEAGDGRILDETPRGPLVSDTAFHREGMLGTY